MSTIDAEWICARYDAARGRLPEARFGGAPAEAPGLLALAAEFDAFLLDAFGVLNVGDTAIDGAPDVVAALQRMGKPVIVLTNGATHPPASSLEKLTRWGYRLEARNVVASRYLVHQVLQAIDGDPTVGFAAPEASAIAEFPVRGIHLEDDAGAYDAADCFVFLSTHGWTDARQRLLHASLAARPRPLLVANPDVAAPRESGFSLEPGFHAHQLMDQLPDLEVEFFGKPYGNAFDEARERLAAMGCVPPGTARIAMVGDTLHTDVLGGAAAGCRTVLVTDHGLFRGVDYEAAIARSGIVPDFIIPEI